MADTSGTMACTIAVKLHRRNLEQVKETPEPRREDRSLQWARVHREIEAEREREGERERDYVHTRKEEIPPTVRFLCPGIIFILSRKAIVWLGPPGSAPWSMNGSGN